MFAIPSGVSILIGVTTIVIAMVGNALFFKLLAEARKLRADAELSEIYNRRKKTSLGGQ